MNRSDPHFGLRPQRPTPEPVGRPSKSSAELQKDELQRKAAEEYARRGINRVYKQELEARQNELQQQGIHPPGELAPDVDKAQLEHYHKSWQEYWQHYYQDYYSGYYDKYFGEVKTKVDEHHKKSTDKLVEMFEDNKKLATQKKRLEDPEAIRRDILNRIVERGKESSFWGKARKHVRALVFAGTAAGLFLFLQFNPVVVGAVKQYLGPAGSASLPSIIEPSSSSEVSKTPSVIIPKIGVKAPVVYDEPSPFNDPVQKAMERGALRYWNTASPGETGNVVILGHSSNNLLNSGDYKYLFVNLKRLEADDIIYLDFEGVRYGYKVTEKQIVPPSEFSHIYPTDAPSVTLITCDPPGTDNNRLYVRAVQISPDPAKNKVVESNQTTEKEVQEVPSAAPSIWGSIF
jgi:LPXTG-site transpeptidase (sortase) family protein